MQPYVENAILHGILNKPSKGKIEIELKIKENSIICSIEDNGVGREKAKQISENSGMKRKSKGMMITKERLEMLNNQGDEEFSVNIIDLKSNNGIPLGTRVEIKVLYKDL